MGIDQDEAKRRRAIDRPGTKHPFFALEHRVIDSPAYADLSFSARALLDVIGRQLTRDNNGHLQATFAWCKRYGFGSEHTLREAIAELISHGFIYRTRSHGANGAWARYAVTWLGIRKRDDLFLDGFASFAWRNWKLEDPARKKSSRQKVPEHSGRKCSFTPELPAESAGKPTAESAEYEPCCHGSDVKRRSSGHSTTTATTRSLRADDWMPAYLARLAAAGLAGQQCFMVPAGRTLQ